MVICKLNRLSHKNVSQRRHFRGLPREKGCIYGRDFFYTEARWYCEKIDSWCYPTKCAWFRAFLSAKSMYKNISVSDNRLNNANFTVSGQILTLFTIFSHFSHHFLPIPTDLDRFWQIFPKFIDQAELSYIARSRSRINNGLSQKKTYKGGAGTEFSRGKPFSEFGIFPGVSTFLAEIFPG